MSLSRADRIASLKKEIALAKRHHQPRARLEIRLTDLVHEWLREEAQQRREARNVQQSDLLSYL